MKISPSIKLQARFCVDRSHSHILTSSESFPVKQQLSHPTNQPINIFLDWIKVNASNWLCCFQSNCVSQTNSTPTAQHSRVCLNLWWATSIMRRPDRKWALYRNNWICGLSTEPLTTSLHYKAHINHIQQVKYQRLLSSAGPGEDVWSSFKAELRLGETDPSFFTWAWNKIRYPRELQLPPRRTDCSLY